MPVTPLRGVWSGNVVRCALTALLLLGCIAGALSPAQAQLPAPTSPDQLIANLQAAYEQRDASQYEGLLGSGFTFYFSQTDVERLQLAPTLGRADDAALARAMMSGSPGIDPSTGMPVAPVQSLLLILTPESPAWDDNVPAQFAGTLRRSYNVRLDVGLVGGGSLQVLGVQDFYAQPVEVDAGGGQPTTEYRLVHWVDFGVPGAAVSGTVQVVSWGWVRALFLQAIVPNAESSFGALKQRFGLR